FADIQRLLEVLDRLVEAGNSVVVIEHNLDVIKVSDHLIDLGPEGGDEGGRVIVTGTPEEVAGEPASYTGRFLAGVLKVKASRRRRSGARAATRNGGSNGSQTERVSTGASNGSKKANGSGPGAKGRRRTGAATR
ncbi:MAG: excinuclease ABC subunit A, partial [Solirubrobacteraceae bacterium]